MKLFIYSIYDNLAKSHATPFFAVNDDVARRSFVDLVADPRTTVAQHPDDFTLFCVGVFDTESGHTDDLSRVRVVDGVTATFEVKRLSKLHASIKHEVDDSEEQKRMDYLTDCE